MDPNLRTILMRDNPWLVDSGALSAWLSSHVPEPFVRRTSVESSMKRWSEPGRAHLVIGPRQAGKSTTIWAHLKARAEPVLFVDCEQALVQAWCRSAPLFLEELEATVGRVVPLYFEEVQHLEDAGLFLKGLVDRGVDVPILVSGSSSYHLGARVRESLAGRASRTRLLPFSFSEICDPLEGRSPIAQEAEVARRFERHLVIGGYPEVWLSDDPDTLLTDLVEAFILRDASDFFRIARPDAFRRLLHLAARQSGSLANLSEWAALLGVSRDTVASYLEILESSHVTATVPPFAGGRRSELTKMPKIHFIDSGIRNQLVHNLRPTTERSDLGAVLESWVFSELWKLLPPTAGLHFWRSTSKAEVDFVVTRGDLTIGVEVKAGRLGRPTLPRSARSFIDAYQPLSFFVVCTDISHHENLGTTRVEWLHPRHLADRVTILLGD